MSTVESFPEKKEYRDPELSASGSFDEITLEYVSGVSSASKSGIALNRSNGNVAFIASSVLALFDPRFSHQAFIENSSSREIKSVTFSDDGRFLAFGENGVNPCVSVYNAKLFTHISRFQVEERKCAIKSLLFHPRSIYLALLLAHDYSILVYEFIHGRKLAAARWCVEPLAMTMTKTESILAVCGHRKISCFSLSNVESTRYETNAVLDKRAVLLGKQGNYTFVDITSGQAKHAKSLYTVTACGYLCEIQTRGIFINHVVRISERCFCVGFELGMLFVGCERGVVSLCNPSDLTVIANVSDHDMFGSDKLHPMHWDVKSDIIALVVNPKTKIVTTLMSDQKMHSWKVDFGKDAVECSPVITADDDNKSCPMSKVITSHDIQCTLAQLLLQLELRNDRQNEAACFLQRPSSLRNKQINAIKIAPDGKEIILGSKEGEIKIYEASTGRLTRVIEAHSAEITFIDTMYDDDFKLVATGGRDRLLFILDAAKAYKHVQTINDHSSAIVSISLAHSNGVLTLISSSADGVILIRRAGNEGKPVFNIVGELPEFVGCKKRVYNHSSGYIITGQERGRINVFPADPKINLKPMRKLQVGNALLKTVTIDPTGSFFIACSKEGQYVFHLQSGQQIATLCTIPGFHHLSFSQDLNYFINSNDAGCKFLWRLPSKVVDVMKAKMSTNPKTSDNNEFFYNSYESYFRVCQQLVKQKRCCFDSKKGDTYESDEGDTNSFNEVKVHGSLREDRLRLVESDSFTSCTTFSRSLTDLPRGMDIYDDFDKPHSCNKQKKNIDNIDKISCAPDISASQIFANDCPRANSSGGTVISIQLSPSKSQKNKSSVKNNKLKEAADKGDYNTPLRVKSPGPGTNHSLPIKTSIRNSPKVPPKDVKLVSDQKSELNVSKKHKDKSPRVKTRKSSLQNEESPSSEPELKCGFKCNRKGKWSFKTKDMTEIVATDHEECCHVADKTAREIWVCEKTSDGAVRDLKMLENSMDLSTKVVQSVKEKNEQEGESRSEKENITADSGVMMSPSSSMTFKQTAEPPVSSTPITSVLKADDSGEEIMKQYNNRYKTIQLSNSQETYVTKNIDLFTSISIIDGLTNSKTQTACSIDKELEKSRIQNLSRESPGPAEIKTLNKHEMSLHEFPLLNSASNVDTGDSEIYCQDYYLRKVLLSWALKKLHKERMRRKMKSVVQLKASTSPPGKADNIARIPPLFHSSSPETSTESQPTGTSELSDISDISACTVMLSSNSTVTDSDPNNISRTKQTYNILSGSEKKNSNKTVATKLSIKERAMLQTSSSISASFERGKSLAFKPTTPSIVTQQHGSNIKFEQLSPSRLNNPIMNRSSPVGIGGGFRTALMTPITSPRTSKQGHMEGINNEPGEVRCVTTPQQSSGAMADLFRSQDNYLRKLKEVRENFEKSLQALSAERENQRMEAQKYMNQQFM